MTMLFIGSHATRTCSGDSQRGIFISPRYQLMTGIIYPGKRQFKRAIPACHGQKPWARHGQRKLAATLNLLEQSMEPDKATAQLDLLIGWMRYAELIDYDDDTELLRLEENF